MAFNRRDAMIRLGQLGVGGFSLPTLLAGQRAAASESLEATADACIYIFLWGGVPQQDTWDMKPDAPQGIRSAFKPIASKVPGFDVCDQMPLFAKQTDKVAVIRSLSHESNNHEPSVFRMLTGRVDNTLVVPRNQRKRSDFPYIGSVLSNFTPPRGIPATVTIPRPIGHDGVTYTGTYAGFLGPKHDPLEKAAADHSAAPELHPTAPLPDLDQTRLIGRQGLLRTIEQIDERLQSRKTRDLDEVRDQAMRMVTSPLVRKAFDLNEETLKTRDRYGRNEYGDSFLLARRLIEAGVKLVSCFWMYRSHVDGKIYNVWDVHGGTAALSNLGGFDMLKAHYCLPPLDRALSALLEDLQDRGMLKRTLVAVASEFGRTPKINPNAGREHWGAVQSALLAGGGIRGGQVYGSSDSIAAYPKENRVTPEDYLATIYRALGVSPDAEILDREHRPYRVCEGRPIEALFG